ncbi:MAG: HNH endonuclease [Kofleriaceae bacterium]
MFDGVGTWQEIDLALRTLANDQRALDAREAPLLRDVIRGEVWRHASKVSLYAYLEDVLGYGPKVARDRVRVAMALEELPGVARALANGEHSYTAIRELTRIVKPETEDEWLDTIRDCNSARVQELVAAHREGDRPSDPANPQVKTCVVTLEFTPVQYAQWRQAQNDLSKELGGFVDDATTAAWLCTARVTGGDGATGTAPRSQIQTTICELCSRGFVNAGGQRLALSDAERDLAECDAVRSGSDTAPTRAKKDIKPSTRRAVFQRDRGKCVVPGCRSQRFIEVHHIIPRAEGGSHDASNLALLCFGHHQMLHKGIISPESIKARIVQPRAGLATSCCDESKPMSSPDRNALDETGTAVMTRPRAGLATSPSDEIDTTTRSPNRNALDEIGTARAMTRPRAGQALDESHTRARIDQMATDAISALVNLGFKKQESRTMVDRASASGVKTVPDLIAAALRSRGPTRN